MKVQRGWKEEIEKKGREGEETNREWHENEGEKKERVGGGGCHVPNMAWHHNSLFASKGEAGLLLPPTHPCLGLGRCPPQHQLGGQQVVMPSFPFFFFIIL